jgi:hypothetical protein
VRDFVPILDAEEVEEAEASEESGMIPPVASHVRDVLEFVPTESSEDLAFPFDVMPPDSAVAGTNWKDAPPPVRSRSTSPVPKEVEEPPAIRWGAGVEAPEPHMEEQPEVEAIERDSKTYEDEEYIKPRSRWAKWLIFAVLFFSVGGLGVGSYFVWLAQSTKEERLAAEADEDFKRGDFSGAAKSYTTLAKDYPNSEKFELYRFRADMSELRDRLAKTISPTLIEELTHAEQFLQERSTHPLLPEHMSGFGNALVKMLVDFADTSAKEPKDDESLKTVARAEPVLKLAKAVKLPKDDKPVPWANVDRAFDGLRQSIVRMKERERILVELRSLAKPTYASILDVENFLKMIEGQYPDVPGSAEVRKIVDDQIAGHLATIKYTDQPEEMKPLPTERQEPTLVFDPLLQEYPIPVARDELGLVLSRGVLYGVRRSTGTIRWARRVGIDTTTLPVRVPARVGSQERILVLSSDDPPTLTALDVNGDPLWQHPLQSAALGRPVVVDQRAYLATFEGDVREIELISGKLLGVFKLGQRLTQGGALEKDTSRVYFPADDGCIYVLDVREKKCLKILYTRHAAGSLRGEPILLSSRNDESQGFLVLNQADGLDQTRLRVYDLPIVQGTAQERSVQPTPTLEGWTWFVPYFDNEKLILLSDAGRLGLFGVRQPNNRDQALFPLLPGGNQDLASMLSTPTKALSRGRSEIVQMWGEELWVLAQGRLQRLRFAWNTAQGPMVVPVWKDPLEVGSPIHASQRLEGSDKATLLTVTQPPGRSCTWVTAVGEDDGKPIWRRQFGLVAQGEAIAFPIAGGEPIWVGCDQAGALFALDPTQYKPKRGDAWLSAPTGRNVLLAGSLEENPDFAPMVLLTADGKTAYALACPGNGRTMVIRQVTQVANDRQLKVVEETVDLRGTKLAGRPVIMGTHLMLPQADGMVARVPIPYNAMGPGLEVGPPWRAERGSPQAKCHIASLGGDRFVTSDGGTSLFVYEWQANRNVYQMLPKDRGNDPALALTGLVNGLVVIPGKVTRIVASDSTKTLTMAELQPNGALEVKRTWTLDGNVTMGPFVTQTKEGPRIGCVMERAWLVWINPESKTPQWKYPSPGNDAFVGEPTLVGEHLMIADQSGLFVAVDVKTGRPIGDGYKLRGSVAPAASPVPFHKDRLLAPLSDGTMMLLGMDRLK